MNKTTMSCTVHVLMTAGTINVATLMVVNVASRKEEETLSTATAPKADGGV